MRHELRTVLVCSIRKLLALQILIADHRRVLYLWQHPLLTETTDDSPRLVSLRGGYFDEVFSLFKVAAELAV